MGSKVLFVVLISIVGESFGAFNLGESPFNPTKIIPVWGVTDVNNTKTCILLSGLFEILVPYDTDYFSKSLAIIHIPMDASISGYCDREMKNHVINDNVQSITLTWSPDSDNRGVKKHSLTFTFQRRGNDDFLEPFYQLVIIHGIFQTNDIEFPDAFNPDKIYEMTASNNENEGLMSAPNNFSYYCKSTKIIEFDDGENRLDMAFVRAQAFRPKKIDLDVDDYLNDQLRDDLDDGNDFGPKSFCSKDGYEVILMAMTYVIILALIGLAVFYIVDRNGKKRSYIYL